MSEKNRQELLEGITRLEAREAAGPARTEGDSLPPAPEFTNKTAETQIDEAMYPADSALSFMNNLPKVPDNQSLIESLSTLDPKAMALTAISNMMFPTTTEASKSSQRAATAGNVTSKLLSKVPGIPTPLKMLMGGGAVGIEQAMEGSGAAEGGINALMQGALPEGVPMAADKFAKATASARRSLRNLVSKNADSITADMASFLKSNDPRFESPRPFGNNQIFDTVGQTGGVRQVIIPTEDLRQFRQFAKADKYQAAVAKYKGKPLEFAAVKSSIEDVKKGPGMAGWAMAKKANLEAAWAIDNLFPNTKRIEAGDITKAIDKFGPQNIALALGPDSVKALKNLEKAMELAPGPTTLGGKFKSVVQYTENRFMFDLGRMALGAGALGGGGAALGASMPVVAILGVGGLMAAATLNPRTSTLLLQAVKEGNVLAAQGLFRDLAQAGFNFVPNERGVDIQPPQAYLPETNEIQAMFRSQHEARP